MGKSLKIIVNVIPLVGIKTGIGRYIEGLYTELEKFSGLDIYYFDGCKIYRHLSDIPSVPMTAKLSKIFWKIPPYFSFLLRLLLHFRRELIFRKLSQKFDLYHETGFFPFVCKIPVVFTLHDLSLMRFPSWHPKERVFYFNFFFNRRLNIVTHIMTVSYFIRHEISYYLNWPLNSISVIYPGYNAFLFYPRPRNEIKKVCQKYNILTEYYLFVGTGDPRKNFSLLQRAAGKLKYPLVTVGWSGWHSFQQSSKILATGYLSDEDLACLYSGARALIFPSLYEGFGLPPLEAMACGCPVVLAPCASLPEVGGEAAIYLENPQDESSLLEYLNLLEDSYMHLFYKTKSVRQARQFSWKKAAQKTRSIFLELTK